MKADVKKHVDDSAAPDWFPVSSKWMRRNRSNLTTARCYQFVQGKQTPCAQFTRSVDACYVFVFLGRLWWKVFHFKRRRVTRLTGNSHAEMKTPPKAVREASPPLLLQAGKPVMISSLADSSLGERLRHALQSMTPPLPGAQTKSENIPKNTSGALLRRAESCFLPSPREFVFIIQAEDLRGKLVLLMKITSWENKWIAKCQLQRVATCVSFFFFWALELDESCWGWIIPLGVSLCFAPYPGCEQC